jgi:hypothetical protein
MRWREGGAMAKLAKCVTLNGRHIWEKHGLDIKGGKLVRLRKCHCCGAEKAVAY